MNEWTFLHALKYFRLNKKVLLLCKPHPVQSVAGGYPISEWRGGGGYPIQSQKGVPCQDLIWVPLPDMGYLRLDWMGYSPCLEMGYPPIGTGLGTPCWDWMVTPPSVLDRDIPPFRTEWGYPHVDRQTDRHVSEHYLPSYFVRGR